MQAFQIKWGGSSSLLSRLNKFVGLFGNLAKSQLLNFEKAPFLFPISNCKQTWASEKSLLTYFSSRALLGFVSTSGASPWIRTHPVVVVQNAVLCCAWSLHGNALFAAPSAEWLSRPRAPDSRDAPRTEDTASPEWTTARSEKGGSDSNSQRKLQHFSARVRDLSVSATAERASVISKDARGVYVNHTRIDWGDPAASWWMILAFSLYPSASVSLVLFGFYANKVRFSSEFIMPGWNCWRNWHPAVNKCKTKIVQSSGLPCELPVYHHTNTHRGRVINVAVLGLWFQHHGQRQGTPGHYCHIKKPICFSTSCKKSQAFPLELQWKCFYSQLELILVRFNSI